MRRAVVMLLGVVLCPLLVFAQGQTGEVTGAVTDASGAVVANASVTITNVSTNVARELKTNASGIYDAPSLLPGPYTVKVAVAGFQTAVAKLELQVSQIARQDFSLQVGNVAETLEVQGVGATLETESMALGTTVENKRIEELPLNGRNYLQLAALVPAATTYGPGNFIAQNRGGGDRAYFQLNISGQRLESNHYMLDGIENTDPNYGTYLFQPSVDALQEFKVSTSTYTAEYGHNIAQIAVITKSGGNEYHGALFEFLRNSKLDAKNFFDKPNVPIVPFKRNQFGGVIGGPVQIPKVINGKNKLFFFFNYEGLRQRKAQTSLSSVPTASDRAGNFAGSSTVIYDPNTRVISPDGARVLSVLPFPGNVIPTDRIAPNATFAFQNFLPLPNNPSTGYANNYLSNESATANADSETVRIDWAHRSNSNFMFRYSHGNEPQYSPTAFPEQGAVNTAITHQGVLGHTLVFGSSKVNEFRFGVSRLEAFAGNLHSGDPEYDYVKKMNIPVVLDTPLFWGIPYFQPSFFTAFGDAPIGNGPYANWDTIIQWNDNFSYTHGRHSIKFGGEYMRTRYNNTGNDVARGRFSWNGQYTAAPGVAPQPQNAVADFLLGLMSSSEGQPGAVVTMLRNWSSALYVQDQWKLTPKLTITYGARWEVQPGYTEKYDHFTLLDIHWDFSKFPTWVRTGTGDFYGGTPPPQFPLPPGIPIARDGRFGRTLSKTYWHNIAPRLGFAYSITPKTVIRAGMGVYYTNEMGNTMFDVARNMPFTMRIANTANAITPNQTWEQPYSNLTISTLAPNWQWGDPTTYVPQWSFTVQRQFGESTSVEAAYVGSAGVHLYRTTYYNEQQPGSPAANLNLRRPYPQFGFVQDVAGASHSSYHSMQLRLQRRLSKGLSVLSSFTWQKAIDDGSGVRQALGDSYVPQDVYNLRAERGPSAFQYSYGWVTSALYEFPIGRGKPVLGNANKVVDAFLGGWQMGGIYNLSAGFPFSVFCQSGATYQNTDTTCRADATGQDPSISNPTPNQWFNLAAFTSRIGFVPGVGPYRFGSSGRNVVIGPGVSQLDFSMQKVFRPTERMNVEFRSEFFNIANHPIFANPGSTVGTPTYGVVSGTRLPSRQIQFALKFRF